MVVNRRIINSDFKKQQIEFNLNLSNGKHVPNS